MGKLQKSILLMVSALLGSNITAGAQESLVFYYSRVPDVPLYNVALTDISKLTFDGDAIVVHTVDAQAISIAMDDIMSIKFDVGTTGIGQTIVENGKFRLYCRDGYVGADAMPSGMKADAAVYDAGGRTIISRKGWDGRPISVEGLGKGIYIFKVNGNTIKFIRS